MRYSTNYRIIYDDDEKMTLEEVTERLNEQEEEIMRLKEELRLASNQKSKNIIILMVLHIAEG